MGHFSKKAWCPLWPLVMLGSGGPRGSPPPSCCPQAPVSGCLPLWPCSLWPRRSEKFRRRSEKKVLFCCWPEIALRINHQVSGESSLFQK